MRLSLDALVVLDTIDRRGSFSAAAEALCRVPSAITYTVQKLEQDLDVQLFDRSGHRAVLTEAGQELLREGRRLLRAAAEIEERVRRVATGFETELTLAVSDLIGVERLLPLLQRFYAQSCGTRVRLFTEVYGGVWDALAGGRADLGIGAPGEGPTGGGFTVVPLGIMSFAFAVAPQHPVAALPEPIASSDLLPYRAVSAADSSRVLAPRTSGLLSGQDVLTVPDMETRLAAQVAGLGVGFLPVWLAEREAAAGRLVIKRVAEPKPPIPLHLAWRSHHAGRALAWFVQQLREPDWRAGWLA